MMEQILESFPEEELLKADGFDDAIIGVDWNSMRLIYSVKKCVGILQEHMTAEEADEFFEFNLRQAWFGEKTPIWCEDDF
tara:strand:+ start:433 stop:672 length:240 start_codon:yes stop_codon:yes gene_type:complete